MLPETQGSPIDAARYGLGRFRSVVMSGYQEKTSDGAFLFAFMSFFNFLFIIMWDRKNV